MRKEKLNEDILRQIVRESIQSQLVNEGLGIEDFNKQRFFQICKTAGITGAVAASLWTCAKAGGPDPVTDPAHSDPEGYYEMQRENNGDINIYDRPQTDDEEDEETYQFESKKQLMALVESCVRNAINEVSSDTKGASMEAASKKCDKIVSDRSTTNAQKQRAVDQYNYFKNAYNKEYQSGNTARKARLDKNAQDRKSGKRKYIDGHWRTKQED